VIELRREPGLTREPLALLFGRALEELLVGDGSGELELLGAQDLAHPTSPDHLEDPHALGIVGAILPGPPNQRERSTTWLGLRHRHGRSVAVARHVTVAHEPTL
jgi:hypothetical protein